MVQDVVCQSLALKGFILSFANSQVNKSEWYFTIRRLADKHQKHLQTTDLNTEIYLETYIDPLQPKDRNWYSFFNILTEDMLAKHAIINQPFIDLMHKQQVEFQGKHDFTGVNVPK